MLVYWESTQACDLACIHCRAEAISAHHPLELSTEEVRRLFREIRSFGEKHAPHLVITGGDPLKRSDLFELIAYARQLGITVSVTPAASPSLTVEMIERLRDAGVDSLALSLDGSNAALHDSHRGVEGTFDRTIAAIKAAGSAGLNLQINTTVTAATLPDLPQTFELLSTLPIERWALFFLISTGRGRELSEVTPGQGERLLHWLCDLMDRDDLPFAVKSTEAPHLRRIAYQRMHARGSDDEQFVHSPLGRGLGIRDGNGVVFVSHLGKVYPSGFLPIEGGDIRSQSLLDIYRTSDLFVSLRDADALKGKCGRCPYRLLCGGSRARAFAATGDAMESDPLCPYPTIFFHD
jgi:radical SAM protein